MDRTARPFQIVTVTSRDYLPGTQVMLHSFLATNRWFEGEIVMLQDDLEEDDKRALQNSFANVSFPDPSPDAADAIAALIADVPKLRGRARRFLSVEAFHPARTGHVLFLDSDLLFLADISPMLEHSGPLIVCGGRAQIIGTGRDPVTLAEGIDQADSSSGESGFNSFNAGLMLIDRDLRTQENWAALLAQLSAETWQQVASDHTDQAVYNRLFGSIATIAPPEYNYLVGHADKLRDAPIASMQAARVLHFNGPAKPWTLPTHLEAAERDAGYVKAASRWFEAYAQFLAAHHLRSRLGD